MKLIRPVQSESTVKPVEVVSSRMHLLEELLEERRTAQARALAGEILEEKVSNSGAVQEMIGLSYLLEKNYRRALPALKKAIKEPGSDAEAYFYLALAQQNVMYEPGVSTARNFRPDFLRKPVRSTLYLAALLCLSPLIAGKYCLLQREKRQAEKSLEQAIRLDPQKKYFKYLLQEVVGGSPAKVIKHGEKALEHHPHEALFYALVSQAYAERGCRNDSLAMMLRALELKFTDGEFLREHFFTRLEERDRKGRPILEKLLQERKGINWKNGSILDLIGDYLRHNQDPFKLDFYCTRLKAEYINESKDWAERPKLPANLEEYCRYRQRFPSGTYPSHPLFLPVLRAKIMLDPLDDDSRYELGAGLALEAELDEQGKPKKVKALQEAIEQFQHLRKRGYELERGPYPELIHRLLKHYGEIINSGEPRKPRLYLVN